MSSTDPDPLDVIERTRDLAEQALVGLMDRLRHDRVFACRVEQLGPGEFVSSVWREAFKRALAEAAAAEDHDGAATRH